MWEKKTEHMFLGNILNNNSSFMSLGWNQTRGISVSESVILQIYNRK